jgi:hypothetical protein
MAMGNCSSPYSFFERKIKKKIPTITIRIPILIVSDVISVASFIVKTPFKIIKTV